MDKEFIDKVRERIDILQVIQEYTNTQGKKVGEHTYDFSPCPFCGHKHCLMVNTDKAFFNCFSEHTGGDVFRFVARQESISDWEAMLIMAKKYRIEFPKNFDKTKWEEDRKANDILTDTAIFYNSVLDQYPEVGPYLSKERGIPKEILGEYKCGYAPPGKQKLLHNHLISKGYATAELIKAGIVNKDDTDYFSNYGGGFITFPNWLYGRVVDIQGRAFPDKKPKYLTRKGEIRYLYNEEALKHKEVFLCEGIPDTLTMLQADFNACGIYGTGGFKPEWIEKFNRIKKVYLILDPDASGQKAVLKIAPLLSAKARIISLPNHYKIQDVNEYFTQACKGDIKNFKVKIEELIKNAIYVEDMQLQAKKLFLCILAISMMPFGVARKSAHSWSYPLSERVIMFQRS